MKVCKQTNKQTNETEYENDGDGAMMVWWLFIVQVRSVVVVDDDVWQSSEYGQAKQEK